MQPVRLHAEQRLLNAAIGMLVHVLGGSAAMRGSIPPVAWAPPAGSGAPGEPGSGSPGEPGLRRGRQRGHDPLWPCPGRNSPRVRWGLGTGAARRRRQPGTHPGPAAPRGTNPVTCGARRWGHPPPGPSSWVFNITCVRASCPRLSGFSRVKAAPRDTSGHRRSRGAGGAHTAPAVRALGFPKEFFAPLTDDPLCYNAYLYF